MNRGLKVLIVEDDEAMQEVYAQMLSDHGHAFDIASEGAEGLMRVRPDTDLVVTDINMPGMSGATFLNELRKDPRFGTLPVLVITAHPERLPDFLSGPWTSVIRKPFRLDLFMRFVENVAARAAVH